MKDVIIKAVKSKLASAIISINGKEFEVNSSFSILAKVYNEMYETDLDFEDIIKLYNSQKKQCV